MTSGSIAGYYVVMLRRVLSPPCALARFVTAAVLHAVGHAIVAWMSASIASTLVGSMATWDGRSSPAWFAPFGERSALFLAVAGLLVIVVKVGAGVYATHVQGRVAGELGAVLRLNLLDALLSVHRMRAPRQSDQGEDASVARSVAALTDRVRDVEVGLERGLLGGARAVAQLLPIAGLLFVLSPRMAAAAVAVLVPFGWALGRARASYARATARTARERERLLEASDESVRHAELWVTYGAQAKARDNVRSLGNATARAAARLEARAAATSGANEVLGATALVVAVGAARAGWIGAAVDGGTLLAFVLAFFLAYKPMRELAEARLALAKAQGALDDLRGVIDRAGRVEPEAPGEATAAWPLAALELRDVRLARGAGGALSMRVEPGAIVAIVGPTGIGKTTFLRTLLGLQAPESGVVLYGGATLTDAPAGPEHRPFAWVPQDAPLLADTLEANVSLGAEADARWAIEEVGAADLARRVGGARIGAGGREVSGGERQWIALARAIATRQPVLLLDEPTSGLDADAQQRVLDAIARLRGKRSVLIVTHRPEPLAIASVVVRLSQEALSRAA